jgi:hypothetical protein
LVASKLMVLELIALPLYSLVALKQMNFGIQ